MRHCFDVCIQQGYITMIKSASGDIYDTKEYKFFWTLLSSMNHEKIDNENLRFNLDN